MDGYQPTPRYQQSTYVPHFGTRPVGFLEAYAAYWKNYTNFFDRTSCAGYWWVILMNLLIDIALVVTVLSLIGASASSGHVSGNNHLTDSAIPLLTIIYSVWGLATIVPNLAICVRRLHDVGKSWAWILIACIPLIGWAILILFLTSGSKYPPKNRYGYLRQV